MTPEESLLKQLTWAKYFEPQRGSRATKGAFGKPPFRYRMRSAEEIKEAIEQQRREREERRANE